MNGRDTAAVTTARVAIPGTCGELVQGTLDGMPCLVSCPIDRYSVATAYSGPAPGWTVVPSAPKVRAALHAGRLYLHRHMPGDQWCFRIDSVLPHGRGYGSSTADIGALLYALGLVVQHPLEPQEVARLAVRVEPTDSSLFPGLTLWDHRQGHFHTFLGMPPALTVVVLDPGGEVDTQGFNALDHGPMLRRLAPVHRDAFTLLREGLQDGDAGRIGQAATLSALAHQALLPNPLLEPALRLARQVGARGVCRAHSGTLIGLLLDPDRTVPDNVVARIQHRFGTSVDVFGVALVAGGPRLCPEPVLPAPVTGPE